MCYSYPSEKTWSESQLGYVGMMMWKFSQYDGKVIKFHGSSHHQPVSVIEIRHQSNFSGTSHPHPWDHLLGRAWWPSKGAINIEQLYITYVVSKRYVPNRLYIMWFIPTYINLHFFQLLRNIHFAQNVGIKKPWELQSCCFIQLAVFPGKKQATLHIVPRSSSSASSRLHWLSAEFPGQKWPDPDSQKWTSPRDYWDMLGLRVGYVWARWGYSVVQMVLELEIGWNWHKLAV